MKEQEKKVLGTRESGDGAGAVNSEAARPENYAGAIHSPRADEIEGVPSGRPLPDGEELVEYTAPVDPTGNKQDVIVAVNGETVRIKRGVAVKIKRKFWQVLQDAAQQEMAAWQTMQKAAESKQA